MERNLIADLSGSSGAMLGRDPCRAQPPIAARRLDAEAGAQGTALSGSSTAPAVLPPRSPSPPFLRAQLRPPGRAGARPRPAGPSTRQCLRSARAHPASPRVEPRPSVLLLQSLLRASDEIQCKGFFLISSQVTSSCLI